MAESTRVADAPARTPPKSAPSEKARPQWALRARGTSLAGGRPPADDLRAVGAHAGNRAVQRLLARAPRSAPRLPGPVQLDRAPGRATPTPSVVRRAAAEGLGTSPRALPHAAKLQRAFGKHRIDGLKAHISPDACDAMGARAYATGDRLVFGGQPSLREVAHEAAHAIQQRGGLRLPGGVGRAGDAHERHADAVADGVVRGRSVGPLLDRYSRPGRSRGAPAGPVQRLSMKDARLIARSQSVYDRKAQEFEVKLGKRLAEHEVPNAAVEVMLARVQAIVDAWAEHTGQKLSEVYEEEFSFLDGDEYYGAFLMTARNISDVFRNARKKPLRVKLKLVYNAVRNNNLSKWLRVAADDLTKKSKRSIEVFHGERYSDKVVKVKRGFAKKAGLDKLWRRRKLEELSDISEREKDTPVGVGRRMHVHDYDQRSDVLKWKDTTLSSHFHRFGGVMSGIPLKHQRTLTFKDVPDITKMEIEQLTVNDDSMTVPRGRRDLDTFKSSHRDDKLMWSQGSMYYRVDPRSETARKARTIKAHLEAGISGSTDLMLHAADNLGMYGSDLFGLRLAMLAWMLPNRDHSFYEIMKVGEQFGLPFVFNKSRPGMEYQSATNYKPLRHTAFIDLLPERRFPAYFLTQSYRRTLEPDLPGAAATEDNMRTHLISRGFSVIDSMLLDQEQLAWADALEADVDRVLDGLSGSEENRALALDQIKRTPGYTELVASVAGSEADDLLHVLVRHRVAASLGRVGLPMSILPDGAQTKHLLDMYFVVQMFEQADFNGDRRHDAAIVRRLRDHEQTKWLSAVLGGTFNLILAGLLRAHSPETETAGFDIGGLGHIAQPLIDLGLPDVFARRLDGTSGPQMQLAFADVATLVNLDSVDVPHLTNLAGTYPAAAAALGAHGFNVAIAAHVLRCGGALPTPKWERYAVMERLRTRGGLTESEDDIEQEVRQGLRRRHDRGSDTNDRFDRQMEFSRLQMEANIRHLGVDWEAEHGAAYRGLSAAERYGIFQYTKLGGMGEWQDAITGMDPDKRSPGTLGKLLPLMKAAISGLQRLPVHAGTVYNGQAFDASPVDAMDTIRYNFPLGRVVRHDNFLSGAKTFASSFAGSKSGYDLVWVISGIKTGRDIQPLSGNPLEEEVLFPPGIRLLVQGAERVNDPMDEKHGKILVHMREV